ncbi:flagellar export chaperone FliS [Jeotgalibacillus haloalkalitolerans]|uniref:Flagellar secretion chaperone FliS n=1 Tax=Jeotgalibacillus haloalkalitolerans TaxID=3104292 RepID=A0ABU5KJP4_9BACL|nr:flagellar export chaperone FliS [Jeotgalibacillus sp. HH7-29]MDZ5711485.1 flagellar export chaperone FliS [Jeotgalibacillus sp. HH7-29]
MVKNPQQAYANNSVNTASPGELTLMLYNGCLKFIKQAEIAMEQKNVEQKNINIQKAQAILRELSITLKTDQEIGKNMLALYDFLISRLIEANIQNNIEILTEVSGFVAQFRDTWKEVIQTNRKLQQVGAGGRV